MVRSARAATIRKTITLKKVNARNAIHRQPGCAPPWVDWECVEKIYRECPPGHEVDHIIPLGGHGVCGLHVPWNLQYLTKRENREKHRKMLKE